jgi:hypothetical protein
MPSRPRIPRRDGEHVIDVVRPGSRPPGVPAADGQAIPTPIDDRPDPVGAVTRALSKLLGPVGLYVNSAPCGVVVRLTPDAVERLVTMATEADIVPHPSAMSERRASVLAALTGEWRHVHAIAAMVGCDRSDTERELRALERLGSAMSVGDEWRRT